MVPPPTAKLPEPVLLALSAIDPIATLLQPVVLAIALLKYNATLDNKWVKYIYYGLIIFGIFRALYATYYAFYIEGNKKWLSIKGEHCHLEWYFSRHTELPELIKINNMWNFALILTI